MKRGKGGITLGFFMHQRRGYTELADNCEIAGSRGGGLGFLAGFGADA